MKNKTIINAGWIIACRIVQAVLALAVTMISARYLGPSNYGLVNYAASLVNFTKPVMQLGLNAILVKELVDRPEQEGQTLGTALCLNVASAVACILGILSFVSITNRGQTDTLIVCGLYSISLVFLALEMIQYWFQAHLMSKYASLTILLAYIVVSVYKLWLLITGKSVYWFAVSNAIDYMLIAVSLLILYGRLGGRALSFSPDRAREMLEKGKYYIISGLMVAVFAQTDKIMLNLMVGNETAGYYSAAVACTTMTNFLFVAIIDSARPTVLKSRQTAYTAFEENMTLLYSVVIYLALAQSVVVTLGAGLIIGLYGSAYGPSVGILRLAIWYTTFSYIGAVRDIWILAENQYALLWKVNLSGAILNVVLNALCIPVWGAMGAALASLVTQVFTNVIIGFIIKPFRKNNALVLRAMNPAVLWKSGKKLIGK